MAKTKSSGAAAYRKGANFERAVAKKLGEAGWFSVRSPKSASVADLYVFSPAVFQVGPEATLITTPSVYFVQCKMSRAYLPPKERTELIETAEMYGAIPIICGGRPVRFIDARTRRDDESISWAYTQGSDPSNTTPAPHREVHFGVQLRGVGSDE